MRHASRLAPLLLGAAAGLPSLPGAGFAQGIGEGTLRATLSQRFEVDSNYRLDHDSAGVTSFGDTRLDIEMLKENSTQAFRLGFDTGLRALWEADQEFDFTFASPSTANVGYNQAWIDGSLGAELRYRQRNVDYLDDLIFETENGIIIPTDLNQLTRNTIEQRYDANLELAVRQGAPSSYRFALDATQFDYRDDGNGQYGPRSTVYGEAEWLLRLNPVLSGSLLGSLSHSDTEVGTESTIDIAELTAGIVYQPSDVLSANLGLGYSDRTREETINDERRQTEDFQGVVVRGGLNYDVADDLLLTVNARVTTAAPSTRLSGGVLARYLLPRGALTARLAQNYTGDTDGDEVRITTAGLGLTHTINNLSSVGFNVAYGLQVNEDNSNVEDLNRADFSATYSRSLTSLVYANLGYRFRWRDQEESASGNAVFFTIGRSFETGF